MGRRHWKASSVRRSRIGEFVMVLSTERLTLCTTVAAAISALISASMAAEPEPKTQEQWAYTRHVDQTTGRVQFLATNMAMEDENAWLVLACGDDGQSTISIIHTGGFLYPLKQPTRVLFRIDTSPGIAATDAGADANFN